MKKFVYLAIILLTLTVVNDVFAEGVKVKVVSSFPINKGVDANTNFVVIQVDDRKNGIICYGLASESEKRRTADGGYPGTSISCVKIIK